MMMYMQGMNIDMKKMIGDQVIDATLETEADSVAYMQTPPRHGHGGGMMAHSQSQGMPFLQNDS